MKQKRTYIDPLSLFVVVGLVGLLTSLQLFAHARRAQLFTQSEAPARFNEYVRQLPASQLSFVVDSLCIVQDPAHSLDAFFNELTKLREGKETVLSIVHLGDSHIQAGHYSGRVMRLMQEHFGNAGRGWIAPFKLTKSNEPDDYFISSVAKEWTAGRCIQPVPKCPVGIGGIGIQTESTFISFDVSIAPNNGAGYAFNQLILYRGEQSMPMLPLGVLKDATLLKSATSSLHGIVADTFKVGVQTEGLQLQSTRRKQGTDSVLPANLFTNLYYGFNLTNGQSGVLYHSIGVNGAMFVHYTNATYIQQLSLLKPALLVVSLGTNETFGRRFNSAEFGRQITLFVDLVKTHMPNTAILLTTPAECYKRISVKKRRSYVRNEESEYAARTIVNVAKKAGIACWDLYSATGGKHSSKKWYAGQWMAKDRIHFTKEGYREQGALLFDALMHLKAQRDDEMLDH